MVIENSNNFGGFTRFKVFHALPFAVTINKIFKPSKFTNANLAGQGVIPKLSSVAMKSLILTSALFALATL